MKKNIIIVGPNPDLFGGIAQYISGILNSSLSEDYNLIHCETGIGKSKNLSHILVSDLEEKEFLSDILYNERKYTFLEKVYESDSLRKIKVFEINYSKIND